MERYPADTRTSVARFRVAARYPARGASDSAAAMYRAEVSSGGSQQASARFWLGKLASEQGDTALARATWTMLATEDSIGYYGVRARREAGLPPVAIPDPPRPPPPPAVAAGLARIDTLLLAGLDSAGRAEVRDIVANPPDDLATLLAWSEGLVARGWGPAAIRLAWQAYARAPGDPRALRAIYPWPNRAAVEAEAAEFGVDPVLLASLVRQESVFDPDALSPAGARGLAQLLVSTAAQLARGLDVAFAPAWLTVPDLNLHLGAAHLAALLRQFDGRVEVALAAYNAGGRPARRWAGRPGADDPDQYVEGITYAETRGYVRAVLRNRELYAAMHGAGR
jgi:soluble lytic murein transglycosylase